MVVVFVSSLHTMWKNLRTLDGVCSGSGRCGAGAPLRDRGTTLSPNICRRGTTRTPSLRSNSNRTRCLPPRTSDVVENLSEDYCDDFVCKSSPAVEQSVKQLARDICSTAGWSPRQFAPKVSYSDKALRRFEGNEKYGRLTFLRDFQCKVAILKMSMLDLDTACIEWTWTGEHALGTVDLRCRSTFDLNVITGKVTAHREDWDFGTANTASAVFAVSRLTWSLQENLVDVAEKVREAANQSKEDMESDRYFVDPMDPKKYIQQQDTTFDDALQLGIVLTLIYACVQVLRTIEGSA